MHAGFDTVLARVGAVFDAAHPHHAHRFTNARANRMKVLVHNEIGIWLAGCTMTEPWDSSFGRSPVPTRVG
jgi:hypothetical protein